MTAYEPFRPRKIKLGSSGQPIPNTECKVVDAATGEESGPNRSGEIWIRGPQVMKGYLNNPAATATTSLMRKVAAHGRHRLRGRGGILLHSRPRERANKVQRLQVAPAELEAVLLTNPTIADGRSSRARTKKRAKCLKPSWCSRARRRPKRIMDYVAERVAPHKKIRRLEMVEQIPKTASGKILASRPCRA